MASDMFLRIVDPKGKPIKGGAVDKEKKHNDTIRVLGWNFGMAQMGTTHIDTGGGGGTCNVHDIGITKYVCTASPALWRLVCKGSHVPEATLTLRKAGGTAVEYVTLTMKKVMVTSISTGGSPGDELPMENITLNFAAFGFTYVPQKEDGAAGAKVSFGWNILANAEEGDGAG